MNKISVIIPSFNGEAFIAQAIQSINNAVKKDNTNQQPDDEIIRHYLLSAMLIRKSAFDLAGLFDETMQYYGSDLDWIYHAKENGLLFNIHDEITL